LWRLWRVEGDVTMSGRVEELYHAALALPESEREAFLTQASAEAEGFLRKVRSLLVYAHEARRLLHEPVGAAETENLTVATGTLAHSERCAHTRYPT